MLREVLASTDHFFQVTADVTCPALVFSRMQEEEGQVVVRSH